MCALWNDNRLSWLVNFSKKNDTFTMLYHGFPQFFLSAGYGGPAHLKCPHCAGCGPHFKKQSGDHNLIKIKHFGLCATVNGICEVGAGTFEITHSIYLQSRSN